MTRPCQWWMGTMVWAVGGVAYAGIQSPCAEPTVLPSPKVHVFILPFQAEGELTAQGRELATIVQRHVLFAALKYRSIAVAELTGESRECGFEKTAARVNRRLSDGQAAVFLRGRLFEQGEAIRLQSTVAFAMRGSADKIEWNLGGEAGNASATVPADPVMFAPRQIPLSFLQMLAPARREARRLHREAEMSSPFFELPDDPEARFGYEVLQARDDWMHVRLFPGGDEGWVAAHSLASGENLKGTFPELYFVDALIGYHLLWSTSSRPAAGGRRVLESTRASFDRYIELASGRAESEARALAMVLKGNATLRAAAGETWSTRVLQEAQSFYEDAQGLAPGSTVASNFYLACSSALCARGACAGGSDQLHRQYLSAIGRDPTSVELVANLETFYEAAQAGRIRVSASAEEIARQKARVQQVHSAMQ